MSKLMALLYRIEYHRQRALTRAFGQYECSDDPSSHDLDKLPCKVCGAAL